VSVHHHVVDVFTEGPLAGNALAVVLDAEVIPGEYAATRQGDEAFGTTVRLAPKVRGNAAYVRSFNSCE